MKYDDASWHSGGNFPEESPPEYGGTHIALFLRWGFIKGWAGELHLESEPEEVKKVIDGELPATEFLFAYCDGKLTNEDFNQAGNDFASKYYGEGGLYLSDYVGGFSQLMYSAPESAHDFARFSSILEKRFQSGVLLEGQENQKKHWWKFW